MKVISLYTYLTVYIFWYINEIKCAAIICDETTKTSSTSLPPTKAAVEAAAKSATYQLNNREIHQINQTADGDGAMVNKGVKKLLHSIQCTLEKAKPWVDELEHEAKRLEQAAKRLGLGILNTFGEFMEKLMGDIRETVIIPTTTTTTTMTTTATKPIITNENNGMENKITYHTDTPYIKNKNDIEMAAITTTTSNNFMTMENDRKSDEISTVNSKSTTTTAAITKAVATSITTSTLKPSNNNRHSEMDSYNAPTTTTTTNQVSIALAIDDNDENEIFNSYETNSILCPIGFTSNHKNLCERQQ